MYVHVRIWLVMFLLFFLTFSFFCFIPILFVLLEFWPLHTHSFYWRHQDSYELSEKKRMKIWVWIRLSDCSVESGLSHTHWLKTHTHTQMLGLQLYTHIQYTPRFMHTPSHTHAHRDIFQKIRMINLPLHCDEFPLNAVHSVPWAWNMGCCDTSPPATISHCIKSSLLLLLNVTLLLRHMTADTHKPLSLYTKFLCAFPVL